MKTWILNIAVVLTLVSGVLKAETPSGAAGTHAGGNETKTVDQSQRNQERQNKLFQDLISACTTERVGTGSKVDDVLRKASR